MYQLLFTKGQMIANTPRLFTPSKNSLDRYLFPPVCVNWSAKVIEFIPQEKFILLDRFQWLFKICLLRINLWSKKHACAQELGFEKKKINLQKLIELSLSKEHIILRSYICKQQLVSFLFFRKEEPLQVLIYIPFLIASKGATNCRFARNEFLLFMR